MLGRPPPPASPHRELPLLATFGLPCGQFASAFNQPLRWYKDNDDGTRTTLSWDTSSVTDMSHMFRVSRLPPPDPSPQPPL